MPTRGRGKGKKGMPGMFLPGPSQSQGQPPTTKRPIVVNTDVGGMVAAAPQEKRGHFHRFWNRHFRTSST